MIHHRFILDLEWFILLFFILSFLYKLYNLEWAFLVLEQYSYNKGK